jgi:cytidine deaminase
MFEVLSESDIDLKGKIKFYFDAFFEGVTDIDPNGNKHFLIAPINECEISKFGIQKVDLKINGDSVKLKVTLLRPGIFIGKGGRLINDLMSYLSEETGKKVTIDIKEGNYDPWGTGFNKNYLKRDELIKLFKKAKMASEKTYSPFSKFAVGAAVLTKDGKIYTGSNVENSSYGLTICAERTVLSYLIGTGVRDIKAIAVYGPVESLSPCGACRQFIYEFGKDIVIVFLDEGNVVQKTISELLPYGFAF